MCLYEQLQFLLTDGFKTSIIEDFSTFRRDLPSALAKLILSLLFMTKICYLADVNIGSIFLSRCVDMR